LREVGDAGVFDHPLTGEPTVAFVARGGAHKLKLLADERRTAVFVTPARITTNG
jgi:hypothetical protein